MTCKHAGCRLAPVVRVAWLENGHPCTEADLCYQHATEHWERSKGAVASLGMPSPVYGHPGVPIFDPATVARTCAADRDDRAALA
jgi:hypothetical protein